MQPSLQKLIQKRVYDVLSNKYGLVLVIAGMLFCVGSVFMFGEAMVEWSRDKYAAVFNSFSDNIARKSFQSRLCLPVPIDVVYTWVNGSDPELLMNLKRYKLELEQELNFTGSEGEKNNKEGKCTFSQCVQVLSVVLEPDLQREITMEYLRKNAPLFSAAVEMFPVTLPTKNKQNFTVVTFREEEHVLGITNNSYVIIQGHNHTVHKAFITSDWTVQHSVLLHDTIIMSGFPHKFSSEQLRAALPEKYRNGVTKLDLHDDRGIAVLYVPKRSDFDGLLELNNLTIEGKEPTLNAANLVWDLTESIEGDVASASRFQDNEELRYSIRSLEWFAPWIRHIYIVTNGQIPSWLNLDHAGVTLVTHEEIFANTSHLPTFSSPAIEAHIHRIPGLSDKFIYLNDDVMFGKEVWPDDFYTHSRGQKVYLSWPVPNCQEGCPSNWIRDGYCDKACNNSQCDWDGGDCDGSSNASNQGGGQGGFFFNSNQDNSKMYCASGCANNWIADKYCDQSCNVKPCGFDAADCGTENFNQLYAVDFSPEVTQYTIPRGEYLLYLNLSRLLGEDGVITEATYNKSELVRTAAVALKFKVLTVVLYENHNQSLLYFSLRGNGGSEDSQFHHNFTLLVDTRPGPQSGGRNQSHVPNKTAELTGPAKPNMSHPDNTTEGVEPVFVFEDIPQNLRAARAGVRSDIEMDEPGHSVNLSSLPLPTDLQEEWVQIQTQLKDGDITEKGFYRLKMSIWQQMTERGQQNETVRHLVESHKKAEVMRQMDSVLKPHRGRSLLSIDMLGAVIGLDKETQRRHPLIWSKGNNSDGVLLENLFKPGGLPWERAGVFAELVKKKDALERKLQYLSNSRGTRRSLNQFADSLRHVNRIYNREFGYSARKVPSHMPHMVDKHVMAELQERFPEEWDATSSHRVRSSTDMQFAFSYFYYLMGVSRNTTAEEVFDMMDTDHSNVLSDREIRTLATRLYALPLDLQTLTGLENTMIDCSKTLPPELSEQVPEASTESYYVNNMPQVTKNLFINCSGIQELLRKNFQPQPLYKYDIVGDDSEVAFKMIKTNVSSVVGQLDDIRKHPKKFICLNDNIDHESTEAKTVKAILVDFYESMFPIPSQFELPRDYRNRFLRVEELREWKKYRDWLKFWTNIALAFLVIFALMSFFGDKIDALQRSLSRRRPSPPPDPSSPESPRPVGLVESV